MKKSKSTQVSAPDERYFVTSSRNYIIPGTKQDGYVRYSSAVRARKRIDEKDNRFTKMKIMSGYVEE